MNRRRFFSLIGNNKTYQERVSSLFPLVYYPMNETSGNIAINYGTLGSVANGTYTGVTLAYAGFTGSDKAPYFSGGTSSQLDIYSSAFAAVTPGNIGSVCLWARVVDSGEWDLATVRDHYVFYINANNYLFLQKAGVSSIKVEYKAGGGASKSYVIGSHNPYVWTMYTLTWDKTANEIKFYINNNQHSTTLTASGTWSGNFVANQTKIGSTIGASPADSYKGALAHAQIYNRVLTLTEIQNLYSWALDGILVGGDLVVFGDSIAAGLNASTTAKRWANILAANKNATVINSGLASTILQNTIQNTVDVIGGASTNNGRDTVATRVVAYAPNYVAILYGLNDLRLNDAAITVANFQNDLGEVVDAIIAGGTPVANIVIGSPTYITNYGGNAPYNAGTPAKHATYVTACEAVATAKGTKYANVYQAMVDGGGASLLSGDGLHPNDAGHAVIATAFINALG